jgi:basic membrane protein A and related proteins
MVGEQFLEVKTMFKKATVILAILMVASLVLSACGGSNASGNIDCSIPEVFCVGLVTDVGKIDDKSFNQSTWDGVKQAEKELKAHVQYIETTVTRDYAKNIAAFADEKYDVIVTVGFNLGEATLEAARQYPGVMFIGVDQPQAEKVSNVTGLVFPEDQAGFLVGALSAMLSKSGKIGAVCGTDSVPAVWRYAEGFRAGATYIKKSISVSLVYHNDVNFEETFNDPAWGKATALTLIGNGVDIIFGVGGVTGNGALMGVAENTTPDHPLYAIGVDTDQYLTVPEAQKAILSSALKLLSPGTFDLIKLAKDGKFPGGIYVGQASYAPFHDLESVVTAEMRSKLQEIDKALKDGSLKTGVSDVKH